MSNPTRQLQRASNSAAAIISKQVTIRSNQRLKESNYSKGILLGTHKRIFFIVLMKERRKRKTAIRIKKIQKENKFQVKTAVRGH